MIGSEHRKNPSFTFFEKAYIAFFGYPALGLHIRAKAIIPLIKQCREPENILDAGCGNGVFTFYLAQYFNNASVLGIDIENKKINNNKIIAQRLNLSNCSFNHMNVFDIAQESKFDLILSTDNLEHLENDKDLLNLFHKALTQEGILILHVPHTTRHVFGWKRQNFMEIEGHVRPGYGKEEIKKMLEETGFDLKTIKYNYNSFETLFNDISFLITGGREKNKAIYSVVFPFLLLASKIFSWWPAGIGSGIVIKAQKKYGL